MKHTILIIEDEAAIQKALEDTLKDEYETIAALDGELGLQAAKEHHPSLILLDLVLPKMSGFEVLEALKKDEETANIPVIVLTNLEDLKDVQKVLDLGATTYLVKSHYSLKDITSKIKASLS
ncbi:MAG: response regulator [archaeon]|jgi:DNA-binding response OmpR family regulator|nr:response regulator [archaeon]